MKVVKVDYGSYRSGGLCDTCDYGVVYVNDIAITWEDGVKIQFHAETDYEVMSEADWMVLLTNASSRDDVKRAWMHKYSSYVNEKGVLITMKETRVK